MSATQSWLGPSGAMSAVRLGKIGSSWSLSVVAPSLLRREAMLAHQPSHLLAVHEVALVAQLGGDAPITVGLELLADRLDKGEALDISIWGRSAVIGRPSDAH